MAEHTRELRAVPDDPIKAFLVKTPSSGAYSEAGSPSIDLTRVGFVRVDMDESAREAQFLKEDKARLGPAWRYAFGW